MPFTLDLSPTFQAPVRFGVPGADGTPVRCEFTATFRRLDDQQAEDLAKEAARDGLPDRDVAARLLAGWGADVMDAQGLPMPFTPGNVAAVLRVPNCAGAVLRAYKRAQQDADPEN